LKFPWQTTIGVAAHGRRAGAFSIFTPYLIMTRSVMNEFTIRFQTTAIFMCCLFALLLNADEAVSLNSPTDYMQCAIEAYSDEQVIFLKESVKENKSLVPTLIKHNNLDIPIHYKLHKTQDRWRVYDVVIEGVSLVRNYRTQFSSIIKKEKYAGLVQRIDEKLGKIAAEGK
jgi:ABC-type transporter MlaC component